MPSFEYGNTRLRARRGSLLRASDYEPLLGLDVEELAGALADTAYAGDIERALPAAGAVERTLQDAVRGHLGRVVEDMRSFYSGSARALVDLLLGWADLRNLLTLLRGQASAAEPEDVLAALVPIGGLADPLAYEIARQREFAAAVDRIAAWRLPTPADARALVVAWPEYERTGDLAALEAAVTEAHRARQIRELARFGDAGRPLLDVLRWETDAGNLLMALRVREALSHGEADEAPVAATPLPGGRLARQTLEAVARATTPADALTAVAQDDSGSAWLEPIGQWARDGDLLALEDALQAARGASAAALFAHGDPLGIAIPIAFTACAEVEARNLRLVVAAAAGRLDPSATRARLVFL